MMDYDPDMWFEHARKRASDTGVFSDDQSNALIDIIDYIQRGVTMAIVNSRGGK